MRRDICKYCGKEIGVNQRSAASSHGYMHAVKSRRMVAALAQTRTDSDLLSIYHELQAVFKKLGPTKAASRKPTLSTRAA